jgi:hypothetical protein
MVDQVRLRAGTHIKRSKYTYQEGIGHRFILKQHIVAPGAVAEIQLGDVRGAREEVREGSGTGEAIRIIRVIRLSRGESKR